MNKLYLSSALLAIFALPAFANIDKDASTATCDSATIGATSGTAYMDTDWTANTINLDFYSDGEKISTGSCTYDGAIELPNDPEDKTGYTFGGWQLRRAPAAPQCDLSGLSDTTTAGKAYGYTRLSGNTGDKEATYDLTQGSGEWAIEFYHGIVKGQARCSTVSGTYPQTGNPTDDLDLNNLENDARYCWCQMTSYTPKPWVYDTGDASSSPIYLTGYTNQSNCKKAIRAITGLNSTDANTMVNNASNENPQLITNATGANLAYLTDMGCTTSGGATGHFGEIGSTCPVSSSSWVFRGDNDDAVNCAARCAYFCASGVNDHLVDFRRAVFGQNQ